jgi:hypothetical protein
VSDVETVKELINTLVPFLVLGRRVLVLLLGRGGVSTTVLLLLGREGLVLLGLLTVLVLALTLAILVLTLAVLSSHSSGEHSESGDRELHCGGSTLTISIESSKASMAERTEFIVFVGTLKCLEWLLVDWS